MASKIKGTSTAQLLKTDPKDLVKMNEKELRAVVSRMADAANKRINRLEQSGISSQALAGYHRAGSEKFSTKGLNLNQLRGEYSRIKAFMTAETGTIKGAKTVEQKVISGLSERGVDISPEQYKDFWRAYEKLKERDASVKTNNLKYKVLQEINNEMTGDVMSIDEIVNNIEARLDQLYEETQENSDNGVSSYYTIE